MVLPFYLKVPKRTLCIETEASLFKFTVKKGTKGPLYAYLKRQGSKILSTKILML